MAKPRRPCVFCSKTGKLTAEHVWGRWLRKVLPPQVNKHRVQARRIGPPGVADTVEIRLRAGDPLNSNVKIVCAECNNGWLSKIQEAAKPYLIPLIRGERFALNPEGQRAVATWCAMATMTGEYLDRSPDSISVAQADRDHLMQTGTAPPHWKIWIGRYIGHALPGPWQHYTVPIVEGRDVAGDDPDDRLRQPNTQVTTCRLDQLVFHTMSSKDRPTVERWDWPLGSRLHRLTARIAPSRNGLVVWPPDSLSDGDVYWLSNAFEKVIDGASRSLMDRRLF